MRLLELRKKNNLTQEDMAKHLNVSRATYNGYELQKYEPSIISLIKIADCYKVSLDYLLGRDFQNDFSYVDNEYADFFRIVLKLKQDKFYTLKGYILRLLQE